MAKAEVHGEDFVPAHCAPGLSRYYGRKIYRVARTHSSGYSPQL